MTSKGALPGVPASPLVGNYYGVRFEDGRIVSIDPEDADCGYGVGQVTDGMRLNSLNSGGAVYSADQQMMIATDYLANMAAAHNILVDKWNTLKQAGLITDDMSPEFAENWYLALWAYNTGYNLPVGPVAGGPRGLGWTNNPANSDYRFDRRYFLRLGHDDQRFPADWPYQERVLGFVEKGLKLRGELAFEHAVGFLQLPVVTPFNDFLTAPVDRFVFCTEHNECDPNHSHPFFTPVQGDQSFCTRSDRRCWWNQPADFLPPSDGHGVIEHIGTYTPGNTSVPPSVENPYPPVCKPHRSNHPPFQVTNNKELRVRATIIDNVSDGVNVVGCSNVKHAGSFSLQFSTPIAAVDLTQLGAGYGGHSWHTHTNWETCPDHTITGVWTPPAQLQGWHRVLVHIPVIGADSYQADYQIFDGTEGPGEPASYHRVANQRWNQDQWVDLGIFRLRSGARIELANVTYSDHGQIPERDVNDPNDPDEVPFYADGKPVNIAWDAVALLPAKRAKLSYVALGDSYSSGEGDGSAIFGSNPFLPNTDVHETSNNELNACHRSTRAYGPLAFAELKTSRTRSTFGFIPCSGARIVNLEERGATRFGEVPQLGQGWLDENTTHVTIGIGGNDVRFSDVLTECLIPELDNDCTNNVLDGDSLPIDKATTERIDDLAVPYDELIGDVRELAPNAQITMVGYPRVVWPGDNAGGGVECNFLSGEERRWMAGAVADLNSTIETAAKKWGASFVDLVPVYDGHEACRPIGVEAWINGARLLPTSCNTCNVAEVLIAGSFHPNALGHQAAAPAVVDGLRGG